MRAIAREQATQMAEDPQLWPLRLRVIEAHPALLAKLSAAFGEFDRALAAAIAERTGTRVDDDVLPMLLAGVAGAAMRTSLHRWLASGFTASLPDLVDEAWDALATGLPG
jgi:hypothetical protein